MFRHHNKEQDDAEEFDKYFAELEGKGQASSHVDKSIIDDLSSVYSIGGSRMTTRVPEFTPEKPARLAKGTHKLRDFQGRRVDRQDLDAADSDALQRSIKLGLFAVGTNIAMCIFNFILLFSYTGGINTDGDVEASVAATLILTLFIGVLIVPGSITHLVEGLFLAVDVYQTKYIDREAFFYTSTVLMFATGTFFASEFVVGACLVVSASDVMHIVLRVLYFVLACAGLYLTYQVSKLQETAAQRLIELHRQPDGRQIFSEQQGRHHQLSDKLYGV